MIYLISVLSTDGSRYRVWGYYHDRDAAGRCVVENWSDIFERGHYGYAIVSAMGEGPLAIPEDQEWYGATFDENGMLTGVADIIVPKEFAQTSFGF